MDFSNVVFSTVYLRQMKDDKQMNELYRNSSSPLIPPERRSSRISRADEEAAEQISFIAVGRKNET